MDTSGHTHRSFLTCLRRLTAAKPNGWTSYSTARGDHNTEASGFPKAGKDTGLIAPGAPVHSDQRSTTHTVHKPSADLLICLTDIQKEVLSLGFLLFFFYTEILKSSQLMSALEKICLKYILRSTWVRAQSTTAPGAFIRNTIINQGFQLSCLMK